MDLTLKTISKSGIPEAIAKAELYRYLNEPEEAESICRDVLAAEPKHVLGLRTLGLAITDQFTGGPSDRYGEVDAILRWNRCVRLLQSQPDFEAEEVVSFEGQDGPPE